MVSMSQYAVTLLCLAYRCFGKRLFKIKSALPSDISPEVNARSLSQSVQFSHLVSLLSALHLASAFQAPGVGGSTLSVRVPRTLLLADSGVAQTAGPVLKPSLTADPTQFDTKNVANPVVLPPQITGTNKWQLYYYGNAGSWAAGKTAFLPTGWIGLAESTDGIHWEKVPGKEQYGSILAPTGNPEDWDGIQIGVGDVVRVSDDELHMYYFGAPGKDEPFEFTGIRMSIGRASSRDGGRTWQRMGKVFDYAEDEGKFASWPRLMLPRPGENTPWKMIYHAFNGKKWSAFAATSNDKGETWSRDGKILGPGPLGSWDDSGVGTRTVAQLKNGEWVMVYEAVGAGKIGPFPAADLPVVGPFLGAHRLGVARLNKVTNVWEKDSSITGVPGGPIFEPGKRPLDPWTSLVIGTPYLLVMEDGSLRLYFCSRPDLNTGMGIGLVESETGDLSPSSWKTVSP